VGGRLRDTPSPLAGEGRGAGSIRVLIVDDQALVRAGFRMILEAQSDLEVVGEAGDGTAAIDAVRTLRPDVVLMDIRMPGVDGIEATRRLTEAALPSKIVILTTYDLDEYVFDALAAGASGFLLKHVPPEDLVHGVRVVAGGEALLAPSITKRLIEQFARQRAPVRSTGTDLKTLTDRELEVLKLLGRGLSNPEIARELQVGEATVKTHVAHVLDKLELRDRVQAVIFAYEVGLIKPGAA
jgi:DNA-binding NarL/FixJ family response regulator